MQIQASVFICVHPWFKKDVKSTVKTTAGLDYYWCPFKPIISGEKENNHG